MKFCNEFSIGYETTEHLLRISRKMIDAISISSALYDVLIVFQVKSHRMLKSTLLLADEGYAVEGEVFFA